MQLPLSFQIQNHGRQLLRQTLDKYYAVGESSDAVTLAWNFFMAEVMKRKFGIETDLASKF